MSHGIGLYNKKQSFSFVKTNKLNMGLFLMISLMQFTVVMSVDSSALHIPAEYRLRGQPKEGAAHASGQLITGEQHAQLAVLLTWNSFSLYCKTKMADEKIIIPG